MKVSWSARHRLAGFGNRFVRYLQSTCYSLCPGGTLDGFASNEVDEITPLVKTGFWQLVVLPPMFGFAALPNHKSHGTDSSSVFVLVSH